MIRGQQQRFPRLVVDNPPRPAWVPDRPRDDAPAVGLAIAVVGGLLFYAGVAVAVWWWWGRP